MRGQAIMGPMMIGSFAFFAWHIYQNINQFFPRYHASMDGLFFDAVPEMTNAVPQKHKQVSEPMKFSPSFQAGKRTV